jgi:hypothetical protein
MKLNQDQTENNAEVLLVKTGLLIAQADRSGQARIMFVHFSGIPLALVTEQ